MAIMAVEVAEGYPGNALGAGGSIFGVYVLRDLNSRHR